MDENEATARAVVECANRVLGTSRDLPTGGDVSLEEFGFDSLSLFAFFIELSKSFGVGFDELLAEQDAMVGARSVAAVIDARRSGRAPSPETSAGGIA